ncbi:MAG TPA: hypothetical protein VLT13_12355, partial [Bacteroidota bacterium]|nr:hypothetical protein [Bacteroidota bacterium]
MPVSLVDPVRPLIRWHALLKHVPVLTLLVVMSGICAWGHGQAGSTRQAGITSPGGSDEQLDVLHYDLALTLDMTGGFLGGRMTMQVRIPPAAGATDRIPVHSAHLDIDSVFVNGTRCTVETDSVNEQIAIIHPAGG